MREILVETGQEDSQGQEIAYPEFIRDLRRFKPKSIQIYTREERVFSPESSDTTYVNSLEVRAVKGLREVIYQISPEEGKMTVPPKEDWFRRHSNRMSLRTLVTAQLMGETFRDLVPGVEVKINGRSETTGGNDNGMLINLTRKPIIFPFHLPQFQL